MGYKTVDGLMRHLRSSGINIGGSKQKRQLINTGYFHGYKGYRFFRTAQNKLPFVSYEEIYATIQYDSKLKALFYDKIMFIETAVKNIALDCILTKSKSESIHEMYKHAVSSYKNAPVGATESQKKELQKGKLRLEKMVQSYLVREYESGNPKITHYYNNMNYSDIPLWALLEIMTMGDFGYLLSCLTIETRDYLSKKLGLNVASDTNRELVYKYIYTLKDLRNAIAHNAVIFDTRFRRIDPTRAMTRCLENEIGLPYMNFKTLGDYLILVCYYLKLLHVPKREIQALIREYLRITNEYKKSVNAHVSSMVIHPDLLSRLSTLMQYI